MRRPRRQRPPSERMRRLSIALLLSLALGGRARAEGPAAPDDVWRVRSVGRLAVDAGVLVGRPAAWDTGMTTGVGAGLSVGQRLVWGVRASWSTATESSLAWAVARQDLRLRAAAAVQHAAGRGAFALRLEVGPTLVREDRVRNQGKRAGLSGSDLETITWAALPAADLQAVITVHVAGPWLLIVSGGPSLTVSGGTAHGGWTAQLGTGWQP